MMKWIREHKLITVILCAFIIAVVLISVSFVRNGKEAKGTGLFNRLYISIEKPMTSMGSSISENFKGMFSYKDMKKENEELKKENDKLKKENARLQFDEKELSELRNLADALNYDFAEDKDRMVSADVVSMDGTNWQDVFSIDRGKESGIKEGNIVICGDGLVGRVISTGDRWSKIVSIYDKSGKVSFKVDGNLDILGILTGARDGKLEGFLLDSNASVKSGEYLVTSGMGKYPAGIKIGKVVKSSFDSGKQLVKVIVKPQVDFADLSKVSVIL